MISVALAFALAVGATAPAPPPSPSPSRDTDGDGLADDVEDANHDGIVDADESDPNQTDTDLDNVPDDVERRLGTNPNDTRDLPDIPEPLYVDLVRNLGSKRGEVEANVLATAVRGQPLRWSVEAEAVLADGFGLEVETTFTEARADSLKLGAQATLGQIAARRLEVGALGMYEHRLQSATTTGLVAAVVGVRFSSRIQGLTLLGPQVFTEGGRPSRLGAALHPSVFYQASRAVTVGVELGYRAEEDGGGRGSILPQVHWHPVRPFKLQIGGGAEGRIGDRPAPFAAIRVCVER